MALKQNHKVHGKDADEGLLGRLVPSKNGKGKEKDEDNKEEGAPKPFDPFGMPQEDNGSLGDDPLGGIKLDRDDEKKEKGKKKPPLPAAKPDGEWRYAHPEHAGSRRTTRQQTSWSS
ncbi:hypothetical protein JW721_01330 [Candidatus Micrarchaeota archaeon]|nr:hypothetical protein [Candidatus Micrarchaeota archaeon]